MQELTKVRWMGRLLQKTAIESALADFHDLLDEAEKSFQVQYASLSDNASESTPLHRLPASLRSTTRLAYCSNAARVLQLPS